MKRKLTLSPRHSAAIPAVAQLFLHEGIPFQRSAAAGYAPETGRCTCEGNV